MSDPAYSPGWELPYPSARQPVMAEDVVAASQPLATQAGLEMLRSGGNAVDAAIATAAALVVVEPTGNGLGSDAFVIVWDGARLHGLNASGRSPGALVPERYLGSDEVPRVGWDAVTVPAAVAGWRALSSRFGRLPFARLLEPAVRYAEHGHPVAPGIAAQWARAATVLGARRDFAAAFTVGGEAPAAGRMWRSAEQARSLKLIAETEGEALYTGELADAFLAHARSEGARFTEADLADNKPDWVDTVSTSFGGFELHELPPNGQGIAALQALELARLAGIEDTEIDSVDWVHIQVEAMKVAFADAHRYVSDPRHMDVSPDALMDEGYLRERARLIDPKSAGDPGHGAPRPGGTVYLCAADSSGMMVSFIQSNYRGFGSGVVVPGTGIALNNRGNGFSTKAGHPNAVAPGKRPYNTIIPGMLTSGGRAVAALGVMGGPMQPQGHLQVVLRMVQGQQNPQAASDAPRWQVTGGRGLWLEPGFRPDVVEELARRGHEVRVAEKRESLAFGGAQIIARLPDAGYVAGSDHRKDGQAAGF
ncbi:MAG TPA: gamma-glutamyltransferase family protein [Trueperaceae bacterium]